MADVSGVSDRSSASKSPCPVVFSLPTGLEVSGVTSWAARLGSLLVRSGRQVAFIAHDEPNGRPASPVALDPRIEVVRLRGVPPLDDSAGAYRPYLPTYRAVVRRLADESGRPVVALPALAADSYGLFACLAQAEPETVRVVAWIHNHIEHDFRVAAAYEPLCARFVGVSRAITTRLASMIGWRAPDARCVAYGVEVPDEPPARAATTGDPLRLIYTGRLDQRQKRITALVALSRALDRSGVRHTLTIAGDGPAAAELEERAGATPGVRVLRRAPGGGAMTPEDLRPLLRESDLFVMASRYEGLSVSLLEALAHGCVPVLARTESGQHETIEPGALGEAVEPAGDDDEAVGQALAEGVRRVLGCGLPAQQQRAWALARERFSIEAHGAAATRVLDEAGAEPERWWPAHRPASVGVSAPGESFSVPADACERARAKLDSLAGRAVAVWGAGRHTVAIAPALARTGARIVAVIEDDPTRRRGSLFGWPLVGPEEAVALGAREVVISSWMHEGEMWSKRVVFERAGARVHRLYADSVTLPKNATPDAEGAGRRACA